MPGQLPLQPLLQAEGLPARGLHHVAQDSGQVTALTGLAGRHTDHYFRLEKNNTMSDDSGLHTTI